MKFNLTSFALMVLGLFVGNIVGGMLLEAVNISFLSNPLVAAIALGMIDMLILSLLGLVSGKLSLMTIFLGAVFIFIGSIMGTYFANYLEFTGLFATFLILAIQAALLIFFGIAGKGKSKVATKLR
jgi:hypothetical protein